MFGRLFAWLKGLFVRDSFDIYRPKERLIYHYWDGKVKVRADPMTLFKRIRSLSHSLTADMAVASSESKDAVKAHNKLVENVRSIFQVKSLEEGGLTEVESLDLLDHFMAYNDRLKKNSSISPTPSTPSAASENTSMANGQPTDSIMPSGSIEEESNIEGPELSLPEQPLPSA